MLRISACTIDACHTCEVKSEFISNCRSFSVHCTVAPCYVTPPVVNVALSGKDAFLCPLVEAVYQCHLSEDYNFCNWKFYACFYASWPVEQEYFLYLSHFSVELCVALRDGYQPWCTYLGSLQWNAFCIHLTTVAILERFWYTWQVGLRGVLSVYLEKTTVLHVPHVVISPGTCLTLKVRGPSYLGLTRSISWLLMPWLLTSPGHQQPWHWLCRICRSWSYLKKDFKYLCHINVE